MRGRRRLSPSSLWCTSGALILLIGAGAAACRTAEPRGPDTVGELPAAGAPAEAQELISSETVVSFDTAGRRTTTYRTTTQLLAQSAIDSNEGVGIGWSPWYQARPEIKAWVTSTGGERVALDPATISEGPAYASQDGAYSDARVLRAPLPKLSVGARVESELVRAETRPFFSGPRSFAWWPALAPTRAQQRYVIELPAGAELIYRARGATLTPTVEDVGGVRRWTFQLEGGLPFDADEAAVPSRFRPHVMFSTQASWQAVAAGYAALIGAPTAPPPVAQLAREVAASTADPRQRVARILARLRAHARYEAVELGQAEIVPRTPEATWSRGYGDCKDLAVLLVAALDVVGVEASVALVRVGSDLDVDPAAPGLEPFDHAIVYIPREDLWVDATYDLERPGWLPAHSQGRSALVVRADTTGLRRTWRATSADNTYREVREVFFDGVGQARVVERSSATGGLDDLLTFGEVTGVAEAELPRALGSYTLGMYGTSTVTRVTRSPRSQPFAMDLEVAAPKVASLTDETATVQVSPSLLFGWMPSWLGEDTTAPRRWPMELRVPYRAELEYRVHAPWGYRLRERPVAAEHHLGPARLVREVREEGDVLIVRDRLDIGPWQYTPAEVDAYRGRLSPVLDALATTLTYDEEGDALVAAGRIQDALAHGRAAIARSPSSALAHAQYAKHLLHAGLGDAARAEARKAVELGPKDAIAHFRLGWVLQHDRWGRMAGTGWDVAGARAAYQQAIALGDGYRSFFQNLALVERYNDAGVLFGKGAPLASAIDRYRAVEAEFETKDFHPQLADVLFRAGRYDEADAVVEATERTMELAPVALACAGMRGGADAMRARASAWGLRAQQRTQAFAGAVAWVMYARRYDLVAVALNEAAVDAPNGVVLRANAGMMSNVRRYEDVLPTLDAPARVLFDWQHALFGALLHEPVSTDWVSAELTADTGSSDTLISEQVIESMRGVANAGLSVANFLDIAASTGRARAEGSDRQGYRVRLDSAGGPKSTVLVVREGAGLRVRAVDAASAASEAWSRLARGDREGARRWMGWALDMVPNRTGAVFCLPDEQQSEVAMRGCLASLTLSLERRDRDLSKALRDARAALPAERHDDADLFLVAAHATLEQAPVAEALSKKLLEARPADAERRAKRIEALSSGGHVDQARALWTRWLAESQRQPAVQRAATQALLRAGDFASAVALMDGAAEDTHGDDAALNNRAWYRICAGDARAAEAEVLRSLQASQFRSSAALHTLAVAQAELGEAEASIASMRQSLERGGISGGPAVDYLRARISEIYGLTAEAQAVYREIARSQSDDALDDGCMRALARRRLASAVR